jgi:hypothetical protein
MSRLTNCSVFDANVSLAVGCRQIERGATERALKSDIGVMLALHVLPTSRRRFETGVTLLARIELDSAVHVVDVPFQIAGESIGFLTLIAAKRGSWHHWRRRRRHVALLQMHSVEVPTQIGAFRKDSLANLTSTLLAINIGVNIVVVVVVVFGRRRAHWWSVNVSQIQQ